jgi:hypothetical protein
LIADGSNSCKDSGGATGTVAFIGTYALLTPFGN